MKKFLLTCTNENHDVVRANVCNSREEARELMTEQWDDEMKGVGEGERSSICSDSAEIVFSEGEDEYYWRITEIEI